MRPSIFAYLSAFVLLTGSQGCVYRMTIQQGNYLEERTVEQLQVGMTRSQVRFLLGTPMVPRAFDESRWDYLYYLKRGRLSQPEQRHLTVYFEGDRVARIDRSELTASSADADPARTDAAAAPASAAPAASAPSSAEAAGSPVAPPAAEAPVPALPNPAS